MSDDVNGEAHPDLVSFVDEARRSETVSLEWPVKHAVHVVSQVVVRRMSLAGLRDWHAAVLAAPEGQRPSIPLPMVFMLDGSPVPAAILNALDPDDDARLNEVMGRFLPRSLRGSAEDSP